MGIENPVHLIFIAVVALVVLGPKRLPELAKALGNGIREFREAVSTSAAEEPHIASTAMAAPPPDATVVPDPPVPVAPPSQAAPPAGSPDTPPPAVASTAEAPGAGAPQPGAGQAPGER